MDFPYVKLSSGEIRLLEFLDDSGMRCRLDRYPLNGAPAYIALSYAWVAASNQKGRSPDTTYEIISDGLVVTTQQNLHDALRHLAKHVYRRKCKFWVDFICINQMDVREQGNQVSMMTEIYTRSNAVYAWLGLPHDEGNVPLAVALMRLFYKTLGFQLKGKGTVQVTEGMSPDTPGFPNERDPDSIRAWGGIAELLTQSYWERILDISRSNNAG
ncbi:hypothetical protein MMC25_005537 [Agyrium rufum]|nr:hypothetical protein [Agyrium rufum]